MMGADYQPSSGSVGMTTHRCEREVQLLKLLFSGHSLYFYDYIMIYMIILLMVACQMI